jgi:3-hydroxyisobutyrate dehydrogenase
MSIGFIGLGTMGMPMAGRLLDAGLPLVVWNRSPERCTPLVSRGAVSARSVADIFERCKVVMLMLLDENAVDSVLGRGTPAFARLVRGVTLVMLGTTSATYSARLAAEVQACGGAYVEAPVSGSRIPAEEGALVGMLAGSPSNLDRVEPLLAPLCRTLVRCGDVPAALKTKLAVNHYLIVLVTALAEAFASARAAGVDPRIFQEVLDAGPMASAVSRMKLGKLVTGDFTAQAAIRDVATIAELVSDQAKAAGIDAPLIEIAARQFRLALGRGMGALDMAAVLHPEATMTTKT